MEQDAADAGPGESTAPPAAAPGDWRVAECRDQALLAVAFMAIREAGIADVVVPPPLAPVDRAVEERLARRIHEVLIDAVREDNRRPRTREETEQEIRGVLDDVEEFSWAPDRVREIGGLDAWRPWDCIRWWVAAGETLAAARDAAAKLRAEVQEQRAASERTPQEPIDPFRDPADGREAQLESKLRRAERLDALLASLEDRIGGDAPAFWCADQEGQLRLTMASLEYCRKTPGSDAERLRGGLGSPARDRRDHLGKLVAVCGFFKDINSGTFRKSRERLIAEATRLLGAPCVAGVASWPDRDSASLWRVMRGGAKAIIEEVSVLGAPLFADYPDVPGGRRPVADGVVLVPRAATVVTRMNDWAARRAASGEACGASMAQAIAMAAQVDWGDEPQFWKTLLPAQGRSLAAIVAAWQAVTRLLVATMLSPCRDTTHDENGSRELEPPGEFRLATLLEGLEVTAGGADIPRLIPRHVGDPIAGAADDPIYLRLPKGHLLPVGKPSSPARCSREIFTAVEDTDWLLWAVKTASIIVPDREAQKQLKELLAAAMHDGWERLKARLLASDESIATFAAAFLKIHIARLRLEAIGATDPPAADLVEAFDRCGRALIRRLHDLDAVGVGGLDPPRRRDGTVDAFRWRVDGRKKLSLPAPCEVVWVADPAPFGTQLDEKITPERTIRFTFSASPSPTDADVRLLEAAIDTARAKTLTDACFAPLVRLASAVVAEPAGTAEMPDLAAALSRLREEFAGPEVATFDNLIKAATSPTPEPLAVAWVEILRKEHERFGFECHPPIGPRPDGRGFVIGPVSADDALAWEDSDTVPVGHDVRVTYAVEKKYASRVVSRGRPEEESAEHLATRLESLCGTDLPKLETLARAVRREIDVARTFPDDRERWARSLADALCGVLDGIVAQASAAAAQAAEQAGAQACTTLEKAFGIATRICDRQGHPVTPGRWHPKDGTAAAEMPTVEALGVAFHPTVPAGDVIVERFHVAGEPAREGLCRRSAGQAPAGYESLRTLTEAMTGADLRCRELLQAVEDLPRHVLGEKARLAIPSLYESVWNVLVELPAAAGDPAPWKAALADLIRKPYDMVMFEPSKLGDYPASWIVGRDGSSPRGRRIARVVRPGVRTLDKKLVWPAIVETE